jgi:hypothetical protein
VTGLEECLTIKHIENNLILIEQSEDICSEKHVKFDLNRLPLGRVIRFVFGCSTHSLILLVRASNGGSHGRDDRCRHDGRLLPETS